MKLFNPSLLMASAVIALLVSCQKETSQTSLDQNGQVNSMLDMQVPNGFDFSTEKDFHFEFDLGERNAQGLHRVSILKSWDKNGGEATYSGYVKTGESLSDKVRLPAHLSEVLVLVDAPTGNSYIETLPLSGNSLRFTLGAAKAKISKKAVVVSPDCSSGCAATYSSSFNLNNNQNANVVCITGGSNLSVNINKKNVEVRVCGTVSFQNLNLSKGSILHITDGSDVTFHTFNISNDAEAIVYDAKVLVTNNLICSGKLTNNGDIDVLGALNVNSKGDFINNSRTDVVGHFNNNENLTNNDSIIIGGHLHFNGASNTVNNCYIYTADQLHVNNNLHNYGYIEAVLKITFAANNQGNNKVGTQLYNGSMIKGSNGAFVNGYVKGNGSTSLIQVVGTSHINGGGELDGNVEFCDQDGLEVNNGTLTGLASVSCNAVIPSTPCNPGTVVIPSCPDMDADGVCDSIDKFPNDPLLAGCVCYPACDTSATLAFEDLWPAAGDYDFNDLVMDYNYTMLTNANNEVVKIEAYYLVRAIGAGFRNGFGFQLETPSNSISSVVGQQLTESIITNNANGTEAGQTKSTIIVFDNAYKAFSAAGGVPFANTQLSDPFQQPDTIRLTIDFGTPQTLASLGIAPFNPFIIVNRNRAKEVHLPNNAPTDLVDATQFGTKQDASDSGLGIYYISNRNLPWAINIPQSFDYPIEKADITQTYNFFATWAQSGGTNFPNWFQDLPGFRNPANIY